MKSPNISTHYNENSKEIVVTVFRNRQPVTKVVTCKKTGITTIKVFKELSAKHIEEYVFNIVDENRQK